MKVDMTGKVDFSELWQEGIKDWDGKLPPRMVDDEVEEAFWQEFMKRKSIIEPRDEYAKRISEELQTLIDRNDHVLEIGPGWGNYTFAVADYVKKLTCIDSSASVLRFLDEVSKIAGISNLDFIHAKWEEHRQHERYDVVFGINCFYRMFHIKEALQKIDQTAKRLAIIGMTTGPIQPHYLALHETEGYQIKFPRRDYIHLLNILYELGIYADCRLIKLTRTYEYDSYEQLIAASKSKILDKTIDEQKLEAALNNYVEYKDGKFKYTHQFHGALIYWLKKS